MNERERLEEIIRSVRPLCECAMTAVKKRQGELAKPPGSLGVLEELSVQLAGIFGEARPRIRDKRLLVFAADNGVVEEGVAVAPQSVTKAQTINLTRGKTGGSVLASYFGCRTVVCDVGVASELHCQAVLNRKLAYGTKNILREAAMTEEEAFKALLIGAELAMEAAKDGTDVIGVGEMGIGNTTTSAAILSLLTGLSPEQAAGRGGGASDEMLAKKIRVIGDSVGRAVREGASPGRPIEVLRQVGGLDIAAMAGAFIGAAAARIPAVVDGVISAAAALVAVRICPGAREYMIASHRSTETAYDLSMKELGLTPLFDLKMRLGEGSGCPIAFAILEAACAVLNNMATFEEAAIDDAYLDGIRDDVRCFGKEERT